MPEHPILRFECHYEYDVEDVWCALTGDVDPVPDDGVVLAADDPDLLVCLANGEIVRWELAADGDGTRIVLTHTVSDATQSGHYAARCAVALEALRQSLIRAAALSYSS